MTGSMFRMAAAVAILAFALNGADVYHDPERPSHITLPVIPAGGPSGVR